ncbi:GrpB family protein [Fictibacillus nanhaiensis]|uniref:GrpB family protein n=1 Tax=Fictibacillus nanhaiensis TaxID=742169 RepID=UPI003C226E5A
MIKLYEYNPRWEEAFIRLKTVFETELGNLIIGIEHVGSTSIKGMIAKPIIDLDIIIENYDRLPEVVTKLNGLGYIHQLQWSYKGRETFERVNEKLPCHSDLIKHHLYVCDENSIELKNHLDFRDYLRTHPKAVEEYNQLKACLVTSKCTRAEYTEGKTHFISNILHKIRKN